MPQYSQPHTWKYLFFGCVFDSVATIFGYEQVNPGPYARVKLVGSDVPEERLRRGHVFRALSDLEVSVCFSTHVTRKTGLAFLRRTE